MNDSELISQLEKAGLHFRPGLTEDELQQVSGGNYFNELTIGDITPTLVGRPYNKYTDGFTTEEGIEFIP